MQPKKLNNKSSRAKYFQKKTMFKIKGLMKLKSHNTQKENDKVKQNLQKI